VGQVGVLPGGQGVAREPASGRDLLRLRPQGDLGAGQRRGEGAGQQQGHIVGGLAGAWQQRGQDAGGGPFQAGGGGEGSGDLGLGGGGSGGGGGGGGFGPGGGCTGPARGVGAREGRFPVGGGGGGGGDADRDRQLADRGVGSHQQ